MKTTIEIELAKVSITMTYEIVLAWYRNAVNRKHPLSKEKEDKKNKWDNLS